MANRSPYSESELTNTTPASFQYPYDDQQEMSKAAMKELVAQQVEPLWKALGDAMKERAEMKLRIDALESSEKNLQNQVENVTLNNEQLVDEVEKMRIENAGLRKTLNENFSSIMETVEQFNQLAEHQFEEALDFSLRNEVKEKIKESQERVLDEEETKRKNNELEKLRIELKIDSSSSNRQEFTETFGLHEKQIQILQEKGCLGHFKEIDASQTHGGKGTFDRSCMALILQAMDNGLKDFTIKSGNNAMIHEIGESMMIIKNEKDETTILPQLVNHISIFHKGKYVRFKAKCHVINAYAGFVQREYDWTETNTDGHYTQLVLASDVPVCAFNYRFHVTILE